MGIIVKQGVKGSLYAYIGVIIGFIISSILMPQWLTTAQIGAVRLIESYGGILSKIASLGILGLTLKYYPFFQDKDKSDNGFIRLVFGLPLIGFVIVGCVFFFFKDFFLAADLKDALFKSVAWLILPYTFIRLSYEIFDNYRRSLLDAVVGIITRDVLQRIFVVVILVLFYLEFLGFISFVMAFIAVHTFPSIIMLVKSVSEGNFNLSQKFTLPKHDEISKKSMISFAGFTFLAGFSSILMQTIDGIMVNKYIGLGDAGIYFVMFYFGVLISIPTRVLLKIAPAILSIDIRDRNRKKQIDMLKSTSITLTFTGVVLLVLLWSNIHNILAFLPEAYEKGKFVILFIGLAKLVEMMPGTTMLHIYLSKHYKYHLLSSILFISLLIVSNHILIPQYQLIGAAFASFLTRLIIAIINQIAYYYFLKEQPYSLKTLYCLISGVLIYFLMGVIPPFDHFMVDIIVRSGIIGFLFLVINMTLNLVPEYNQLLFKYVPFLSNKK